MLLMVQTHPLWYALPLVVVVSLVYSATRHEQLGPILVHAVRFAGWIVGFMALVMGILMALSWLV
jgi:hypothetical protein